MEPFAVEELVLPEAEELTGLELPVDPLAPTEVDGVPVAVVVVPVDPVVLPVVPLPVPVLPELPV